MLLAGAGITARGALQMLHGPQGYDPDRLTAVGLVIGTVLAFGLARVTSAALQGAVGLDPVQLASFVAALGFAALAAAYIPARRALAVDPARALRDQ